MLDFQVRADGVRRNLLRIAKGLDDFRPFFDKQGRDILQKSLDQVFRTNGFGSWSPLAPSTIQNKHRRGDPTATLVATGSLIRSVTALRGIRRTKFTLTMTHTTPYGQFHETGTSRMPARPIFGLVATRVQSPFVRALTEYINRQVIRNAR